MHTGRECPCTRALQLTSRSEGWCTVFMSSLQMTRREACFFLSLDTESINFDHLRFGGWLIFE